jgi:hypothetical protein
MTTLEVAVPLPRAQRGAAARVVLQVWDEHTLAARYAWMMFGERSPWLQEHLEVAWDLYLIRFALWMAKYVGWAAMPLMLVKDPVFVLALNTNPFVLTSTAHRMPIALFFGVAVGRMMLPDPVNYYIGRRTVEAGQDLPFVGEQPPGRLKRCLVGVSSFAWSVIPMSAKTYMRRLVAAIWRFIRQHTLVSVFVLTLFPPPGIPMGPNIYTAAGVTKARLVWVLAMSLGARLIWATGFYMLGAVFNPLSFVLHLF